MTLEASKTVNELLADVKTARILIVDDEETNIRLLEAILRRAGFTNLASTTDPSRAAGMFVETQPDLVVLDLRMPELDGFGVLEQLVPHVPEGDFVPVLMLTAELAMEARHRALAMGAKDFLTKPFDAAEALLRIRNLLETRALHVELARHNDVLELRVRERTEHLWRALQQLTKSETATREATEETIARLAAAAEYRDAETGWHIERMSRYSAMLGRRIDMSKEECEILRLAASMHDVGKIGVPDRILRKRGKLSEDEMVKMREHTVIGHSILAGSKAKVVELAALIALTHHERFDGNGYPHGRKGEALPLEGRIAAIADVFDALTSDRVYRKAFSPVEALETMRSERGGHFDPELLDVFLASIDEALQIRDNFSDDKLRAAPVDAPTGVPQDCGGAGKAACSGPQGPQS